MTDHHAATNGLADPELRSAERLLPGGGDMGSRIRAMPWGATPLGPIAEWPQSLRSALSICLGSRFPIVIYWGTELRTFYNDAYAPILANKHPWALGRPCREVWAEIWNVIGPQMQGVLETGTATWSDDQLLVLRRHGYPEECYFSFSFSPIHDEHGRTAGVFTAVAENTQRVVGERRLQTLRALGASAANAKSVEEACRITAEILGANAADIPFSLLYLLDDPGGPARLVGGSGIPPGSPAAPEWLTRDRDVASGPWPFDAALHCGALFEVHGLPDRIPGLPGGPWPESAASAVMRAITIAGADTPIAMLIAGASPRRALDADYRTFFELIAGQAASAIANAGAYDAERQRAQALAELDRAKTAFFSNVSHEFRTPLSLLLGPLDDALDDPRVPAGHALRPQLELMRRNALRLQKLVNTLLDFARLEAGRIEANYEPTDLPLYTAQLASMFESAVQRGGLRLLIDCPRVSEPIYVDRDMWEKVLMNLLSNAFKFTLEGEIHVSTRQHPDAFVLRVRDTGLGIPAAEMTRLFERFHRVRHAQARTHEGTGIGLALVHELVRLHGGEVSVRSEPGRGSEFTVRIPRGSAHLPPERVNATRQLAPTTLGATPFVAEALRWLPDAEAAPAWALWTDELADRQAPRTAPCPGARILVADDNADMRDYLRTILGQYWTVETATDGQAALEMAHELPAELIVSDVMMPGLDGFELLRALRADARTRATPVILLSARAGEEAAVEALASGADAYLVKPFSARELVAYVGGHLELQRLRRQSQAALAASEAKFAAAFEQSPQALTITSLTDGRLVEVNDGFRRLAGYSRDEALGHTVDELGLWADPAQRVEGLEQLRIGQPVFEGEARLRTKTGEERIGMIGATIVELGGRPHVLSSVVDVTEHRRATEALASAITRLQEADQRKDEFLAMLGHELRNPLAAVRHAVEAATLDPARRDQALEIARRQADQLGRLIDDLLDVARITQGRIALRREPVHVADALQRAIDNTRPLIESAGVTLAVSITPHPLSVAADPTRLEQVFANLLSNAAKYTDAGGHIRVAAERCGDTAVVRVRDSGIGIAPHMLSRIWNLFEQGERALDRSQGGLGIGLTLARRLVELHGGRIEAHSDGPGSGAEFVVTLPAIATAATRDAEAPARVRPQPSARVLLVEDNRDAAESLAMVLELLGHGVRTAYDGLAALAAAQTEIPDLMLVDIGLPALDGYEVARRLRLDARFAGVTLVALTGYGRDEDRQAAIAAGFDHHLVKPVDPEALKALLAQLGSRSRETCFGSGPLAHDAARRASVPGDPADG